MVMTPGIGINTYSIAATADNTADSTDTLPTEESLDSLHSTAALVLKFSFSFKFN